MEYVFFALGLVIVAAFPVAALLVLLTGGFTPDEVSTLSQEELDYMEKCYSKK